LDWKNGSASNPGTRSSTAPPLRSILSTVRRYNAPRRDKPRNPDTQSTVRPTPTPPQDVQCGGSYPVPDLRRNAWRAGPSSIDVRSRHVYGESLFAWLLPLHSGAHPAASGRDSPLTGPTFWSA